MFDVGTEYKRVDLHVRFGGQRQSGIVTPDKYPLILAFTVGEALSTSSQLMLPPS